MKCYTGHSPLIFHSLALLSVYNGKIYNDNGQHGIYRGVFQSLGCTIPGKHVISHVILLHHYNLFFILYIKELMVAVVDYYVD